MSASHTTTTRSRTARLAAAPVALLLAAALFSPAGAQAAESHGTTAANASAAGAHGPVATTSRRCGRGRRAVRRHGRWTCKRIRVRFVTVPAPAPAPPAPPAPAGPTPPAPTPPSVVDITRAAAESWARLSMAQGRSVDFRIDGCQPVNASRAYCHIDLIMPNVAYYERFLFNTFVGSVQTESTYLFEGRFAN
jgi:hypothetical protein